MDEAQLKAEKKARKEEKRARKAAKAAAKEAANDGLGAEAPAANGDEVALTAAAEPEVAADEKLKKEKKKDKKKRKREEEAAATSASAVAAEEPVVEAVPEEAAAEAPKEKKKRKKNVKGAFGNDPSKQNGVVTSAATLAQPSTSLTSSSIPKLSSSEIEAFQSESGLTYDPANSTSTYPPILSFEHLPVSQGIKDGLKGFAKPTVVQSASWGVQLRTDAKTRARDCVSIAATGSGKTLAFGVPILHQILSSPPTSAVTALVVAPTRELAMQTQVNLGALGESLKIGVVCIYGGEAKHKQIALLNKKPRIVVGTPGRIIDLMNEGALDLTQVSWLVLDEADRMLDRGFENDIRTIIGQCRPSSAGVDGRITSMFSATWPMSVRRLAGDFMIDPIRITVGSDELSANTSVTQSVIVLQDGREKDRKLLDVLRQQGYPSPSGQGWNKKKGPAKKVTEGAQREKVLVFALYKKEAARVATWLERQGYQVGCIQGDLSQDKRTQALEDFKTGTTGILVATDVAARGLDIPKVELVINYTFPLTCEDYVHRIGRTGRAGRTGISVTFFTDAEKGLAGELQKVLRDAGQEIPEALAAFGGTIKKKSHAAYGDHYREVDMNVKAKKITFD